MIFLIVMICDLPGNPRRCGGQGDILAGMLATFLAWAKRAYDENPER